jgi:RNA polymerase sigma factor (sigma-70 family)
MDERATAIEDLYEQRYSTLRHLAASVLGDHDAAHDAVQEGFARALMEREKFRGGSLDAWVRQIVLRQALDSRRRRRGIPLELDFDPGLVASERDPELAAAIRSLPPRRRLIVFLRYFADLPYAEIARLCGLSEGTVAATLSQAHTELRQALDLEGVEQ